MSTDRSKIEATLRQLQAELAASRNIDQEVKQRLSAMQAEILKNLHASDSTAAESPAADSDELESESSGESREDESSLRGPSSLARRVADAAMYFEESHPSLSTTIGNLAGILGQMGL